MTERLHFHFSLSCIGEGNGNPLQCSCLENPRDRGACWAAISGVAQSQTRLKQLSSSSSSSSRYKTDSKPVIYFRFRGVCASTYTTNLFLKMPKTFIMFYDIMNPRGTLQKQTKLLEYFILYTVHSSCTELLHIKSH